MFLDLLMAPLTAPVTGLTWIAEKVLDQAGAELNVKENLGKQLLTLQLAVDMGEISEAEFERQEEELLLAIQALEEQEAAMSGFDD
ncbi:gas vesicle protein GvpG [Leptolyngbya sp. NK1-12]|uniref:Gas vesicle protein GvpG n=1 Tax=Leptolyngbya sp. NK1-12 TaxID=2547451 RepID=A0AA97AFK2_9CYAN|nr:gas vesicle protein GvpG [Leptolyngbya sp. NK1-12]